MIRQAVIISRAEQHIQKATELAKQDLSNELVFNALGMNCFQAVNSLIELGETIISEKKLGFPGSYGEIFELLYKAKLINEQELKNIKKLIFFRNLISHEYYTITQKELKEMARILNSLTGMIEDIKKK